MNLGNISTSAEKGERVTIVHLKWNHVTQIWIRSGWCGLRKEEEEKDEEEEEEGGEDGSDRHFL